ncbi:hypothetical protein Agabi119p4_906 [Agaricus bisporus var. burnettii]|uniref:Uncharacterized protein n=1 Tax=Agaricus bisporus var. burnettii TaxID=192524 RepID=A0A8H7FBS8_AGABI|nr:hypothetical protein Agabi119p4_906 [Agaricus bisporus var. burnettii]
MSRSYNNNTVNSNNNAVLANPHNDNININNMDRWRVAVLGDGGVGKTALAVQFTLNCFVEVMHQQYKLKQLVVDNRMCFVEVIDTAGQEEYATLRNQWVREGQAFILVYSIASRVTFERLENFLRQVLRA